jgi:hypothetical protein
MHSTQSKVHFSWQPQSSWSAEWSSSMAVSLWEPDQTQTPMRPIGRFDPALGLLAAWISDTLIVDTLIVPAFKTTISIGPGQHKLFTCCS